VHAVCASCDWYLPALHGVQTPSSSIVPDLHALQWKVCLPNIVCWNPTAHDTQCSVLCSTQSVCLADVPPEQVHWFMAQPKSEVPVEVQVPTLCSPAGHDARQAVQVHILRSTLSSVLKYRALQRTHCSVPWTAHALPAAATPPVQVHCFREHSRSLVVVSLFDSY